MRKIFLIFCLIFFIDVQAQEILQIGATYNEVSARIEAFKDVDKKIEKEIFQTSLGRTLCPFYLKNTLISYSITYFEIPEYNFYYNILGSLIKFDIIKGDSFPRKVLGYSRYGNLISVSFEVNKNEQFVYDENGKLIAHWIDDVALNKDNKNSRILKLRRGK